MAASSALRRCLNFCSSLIKSSVFNSAMYCPKRCVNTAHNPGFAANAVSHRMTAVLAGCCGVVVGAGYFSYRTFSNEVKASPVRIRDVESVPKRGVPDFTVTLYQYQNCPFCGKVRAFLDYYGFKYNIVEVNPLWKREINFSKYRKVPFVIVEDKQINDSSVIVSSLRSLMLGRDSLEQILVYYPEMKMQDADGKEVVEFANRYFIMRKEATDKKSMDKDKEERKWRKWVDNTFVHTLSPNIYRTASEARQAFEYFTKCSNFSTFDRYTTYMAGPIVMYFVGKHVKNKYKLKNDVRAVLYEEAEKWMHAVGRRKFLGGSAPNLADLAVYGVLSGLEGLDAFNDLMTHTSIKPWYDRVRQAVQTHGGALAV